MGRKIVRNPETGDYQVFSSIVDAFLFDHEVDLQVLREFWQLEHGLEAMQRFEKRIEQLEVGTEQNRKDWNDAVMWDTHQANHGQKSRQPATCKICKEIEDDEKRSR